MKKIKYSVLSIALAAIFSTACNDSFLDQRPQTDIAEGGSFFSYEADLINYLNRLYPDYIIGHGTGWSNRGFAPLTSVIEAPIMYGDIFSDNMVKDGTLTGQFKGTASTSEAANGWDWESLRRINYFLTNYKKAEATASTPESLNKYAAEAYFFKAWDYYKKVMTFGDVPWYDEPLTTESEELLYKARTPRAEVMANVMECIDFAVQWLPETNGGPAGRVNKDMANFLKARIALFEGTFRKYHTELGLQNTANDFFAECIEACEALIASGRYELYTGNTRGYGSYWELFTFKGLSIPHKEAILARVYDGAMLGHAAQRYFEQNSRIAKGASRSMIDEYLCLDGKPIGEYVNGQIVGGSPLFEGYDGLWTELNNRDPRLDQTVAKPGTFQTISGPMMTNEMNEAKYGIRYPMIQNTSPFGADRGTTPGTTVTGYQIIKHWMNDGVECDAVTSGQQTAIEFRYAEVLLMLAEALYERNGEISDADIDRTINALRRRAGFTDPNAMLTNANIPADPRLDNIYADKLDYTVSPMLREIRRERRAEMAVEGRRYEDLMRWKAGELITVPRRGMKFNTPEKIALYSETKEYGTGGATFSVVQAILDKDVFVDDDGFIVCNALDPNLPPRSGTVTWDDRRYYWPIPIAQLVLNEQLEQNDGWEGR